MARPAPLQGFSAVEAMPAGRVQDKGNRMRTFLIIFAFIAMAIAPAIVAMDVLDKRRY